MCRSFLANVNSRSRSLLAVARPSVCRLSESDGDVFLYKTAAVSRHGLQLERRNWSLVYALESYPLRQTLTHDSLTNCTSFFTNLIGKSRLNLAMLASLSTVDRCSCPTLLEKLVNVRKNQARYFRKIYGTGSVFVFSVRLRNKMRFRYFWSSCSTNGISGIT